MSKTDFQEQLHYIISHDAREMTSLRADLAARDAEVARLRAALRSLVSYTQCHYVDGYCVQHSSPDPCEMAEARAELEGK